MLDELSIVPPLQGRGSAPLQCEPVRELTQGDIASLALDRGTKASPITKIRDRHHALARALASGLSDAECSLVTGYTPSRISILKADPTFAELVEGYKGIAEDVFADFVTRASGLAVSAVNELHDRLEDDPTAFTPGQLLEIAKTFADRTGHAPVQRSVNVQATVDLGGRLRAARQRVANVPSLPPPLDAEFTEVKDDQS